MASKRTTDFQDRVFKILARVPEGKVTTYKALSKAVGASPRAVGGALRRNPYGKQY